MTPCFVQMEPKTEVSGDTSLQWMRKEFAEKTAKTGLSCAGDTICPCNSVLLHRSFLIPNSSFLIFKWRGGAVRRIPNQKTPPGDFPRAFLSE